MLEQCLAGLQAFVQACVALGGALDPLDDLSIFSDLQAFFSLQ